MAASPQELQRRQSGPVPSTTHSNPSSTSSADPYDTDDENWLDSSAGDVTRYIVVAAIILFIFLWIMFGIWHANRRLKQGLPPLWYHRWLVSSKRRYPHRQQAWPQHNAHYYGTQPGTVPFAPGQAYPMHSWQGGQQAPPPPVYTNDSPPTYQPPPGPPPDREVKGSEGAHPPTGMMGEEGNTRAEQATNTTSASATSSSGR